MRNEKRTEKVKRAVDSLLTGVSFFHRAILILKLFSWLITYRVSQVFASLRPRARAHWLGRTSRPRRLERPLLFLIITVAPLVLEIDQYLLWLSIWGGWAAFYINFNMVYRRVPRRQGVHWAGRR